MTIVSKFIILKALIIPQESSGSLTEKRKTLAIGVCNGLCEKKVQLASQAGFKAPFVVLMSLTFDSEKFLGFLPY